MSAPAVMAVDAAALGFVALAGEPTLVLAEAFEGVWPLVAADRVSPSASTASRPSAAISGSAVAAAPAGEMAAVTPALEAALSGDVGKAVPAIAPAAAAPAGEAAAGATPAPSSPSPAGLAASPVSPSMTRAVPGEICGAAAVTTFVCAAATGRMCEASSVTAAESASEATASASVSPEAAAMSWERCVGAVETVVAVAAPAGEPDADPLPAVVPARTVAKLSPSAGPAACMPCLSAEACAMRPGSVGEGRAAVAVNQRLDHEMVAFARQLGVANLRKACNVRAINVCCRMRPEIGRYVVNRLLASKRHTASLAGQPCRFCRPKARCSDGSCTAHRHLAQKAGLARYLRG